MWAFLFIYLVLLRAYFIHLERKKTIFSQKKKTNITFIFYQLTACHLISCEKKKKLYIVVVCLDLTFYYIFLYSFFFKIDVKQKQSKSILTRNMM